MILRLLSIQMYYPTNLKGALVYIYIRNMSDVDNRARLCGDLDERTDSGLRIFGMTIAQWISKATHIYVGSAVTQSHVADFDF